MQRAYAAHNRNPVVVKNSSSGGVFSALAQSVIDDGGIVFGVACENGKIIYKSAEKAEQIGALCGSKYVFVPIADILPEICEQVKSGRKVAVAVSPCQASAVRKHCGQAKNLLVIDFICHGAPPQSFWEKYISELETQHQSGVKTVDFRKKQENKVWQDYKIHIAFENGDVISQSPQENPYMMAFLKNASLRKACSTCTAKGENRGSDITLGDFWGVNKLEPKSFYPQGTSLVLTNTPLGEQAFRALSEQLEFSETDPQQAVMYNPSAVQAAVLHPQWEQFWSDSDSMTVAQLAKKYCRQSTKEKLRAKVSRAASVFRK